MQVEWCSESLRCKAVLYQSETPTGLFSLDHEAVEDSVINSENVAIVDAENPEG